MAFRKPSPPPFDVPGAALSIKRSEFAEAADNVADTPEQVLADHALVQRLMWCRFQGPEWQRLERNLAAYGLDVVTGWIRSGRMPQKCRARGRYCPELAPAARQSEASQDLAVDVVVRALQYFLEKVLVPGKWDPTKGASLRTYFVGSCCLLFPNVYKSWHRRQLRDRIILHARHFTPEQLDLMDSGFRSPLDQIVSREKFSARLSSFDEQTRVVLVLDAQGHSDTEIAEKLGVTPKAVEGRLYRFRKRPR